MHPRSAVLALVLGMLLNCVAMKNGEDEDLPAIIASTAAVFKAPGSTPDFFTIKESSEEIPNRIAGSYVPIGKIYDISLDRARLNEALGQSRELPESGRVSFHTDLAKIEYTYDPDLLEDAGLLEEFGVFYYNAETQTWEMVDRIEVDQENHRVTAYTSHLTPFVLTAIVSPSTSTVPEAPACVSSDYPTGTFGGSGNPQFMSVGPYFQYLQDRDYYIIPDQDFSDLGFADSLGISTCNGNTPCGPEASHKRYTGDAYITFTAHDDLDVYIMYDTRGGVNLADTSRDAPWIASAGFVNTGKFIRTNDAVQRYRVYKNTYVKGSAVVLDGNRKGVTTPLIDTNYWVVIKRAGSVQSQAVSDICNASPVFNPPAAVSNLRGIPGRTTSMLVWQNPDRPDFQGVVVRRSTTTPPANPAEGTAPGGSSSSPFSFSDTGLSNNTTYFYTVFAVYSGTTTWPVASLTLRTGPDSDGDGISNAYEDSVIYPGGQSTVKTQADTDGDGIPDGTEVLQGTDPTNGDATAPILNDFTRVSMSPTSDPYVTFTLGSADTDITGWVITRSADRPQSTDTRWQPSAPSSYVLPGSGSYTLYAFAKDAAGNVSNPLSIAVVLDGIAITEGAYVTETLDGGLIHSIQKFFVSISTGLLTADFKENVPEQSIALELHPTGNFLYAANAAAGSQSEISVYRVEPAGLRFIQKVAAGSSFQMTLSMHPHGRFLYATHGSQIFMYDINPANGELSGRRMTAELSYPVGRIVFDEYLNRGFTGGRCDHPTLSGSRIDCLMFVNVNADGSLTRIVNRILMTGYGHFNLLPSLAISADSRYYYFGASGDHPVLVMGSVSSPQSTTRINLSYGLRSLVAHPGGNFLYGTAPTRGRIVLLRLNNGLPSMDSEFDSVDPVDFLLMDAAGKALYGLSRANRTLAVYSINAADGSLVRTQSVNLGAETPGQMVLRKVITKNDPPIVSLRYDTSSVAYFAGWAEVNAAVSLMADSYDPDAAKCAANSANYVHRWSLINKPAGSARALGTADISGSSSQTGSFSADVPGRYDFEYTFTDDPGTCEPSARATTATVSFTAGTRHGPARVQVNEAVDSVQNHLGRFPPRAFPVYAGQEDIGDLVVIWCIGWLQCAPVCSRYQMEIGAAHQQCAEQMAPWVGINHWTHTHYLTNYDIYWLTDP